MESGDVFGGSYLYSGQVQVESDYYDFVDNCFCNGFVVVYFGYGVGDVEVFVYCYDWFYGGGNFGQFVYYFFNILVYLQKI